MKLRKYPKKPKKNASLQSIENYLKKKKEIEEYNKKLKSAWDKVK